MTAERLLRLYPPAWRARYGDEFLATVGEERLTAGNVFDIVMVAIDAWLSSDVRHATRAWRPATSGGSGAANGGGMPMLKTMLQCGRTSSRVTPRDGLIGAAVMLAVSFAFAGAGILLRRSGMSEAGEALKSLAFSVSFVVSMPWWLTKGTPWKAQGVIIGVTLLILIACTWIATRI
ncbi:MAG TPA: hypothetical protein VGS03_10985 [Candidatus Polarisedimenticolia bacterium]|nr:hypothetical protein [Candidatus Polarisedimenticolia bacterium]